MLPVFLMTNKTLSSIVPSSLHTTIATFHVEVQEKVIDIESAKMGIISTRYPVKPCLQIANQDNYKVLYRQKGFRREILGLLSCIDMPQGKKLEVYGSIFDTQSQIV